MLAPFAAFWWLSKGNAVFDVPRPIVAISPCWVAMVRRFEPGTAKGRLMHRKTRSFRLTAVLAVLGLVLAQSLPPPALAQGLPPPPPQIGAADQQSGDPPARVGRLARVSGTVSFHTQDQDQWSPVVPNYPVTSGNSFWTQPDAHAVIEVSASRIVMAPATELNIATLDDATFQGTTPQGEVYLQLLPAGQRETYALQTPRGLVALSVPGQYGIVAGDTENPTLITVIEGAAHVDAPGVSLDVGREQTASITGSDAFQGTIGPAQRDPFLTAVPGNIRPSTAPVSVAAAMPGAEDLAQYGNWAQSPEYGQVWYPQVAPGWAPYRDGNWAYIEPWGWTWVDSEPWGFAPFHYGRWIDIGGRWAWVPGGAVSAPAPVYAPALVTFLGVGAALGIGVGIGAALSEHRIGWCPLGPREAYHPWYRASDRYLRQVNFRNVNNIRTIDRNVTIENFVNRGAATVVPASVMTASRPVAPSIQRVDPAQFAQVRPVVVGQQPLRPAPNTLGVTPAVARQLNLPQTAPYGQRVAPGPVIRAAPVVATGAAPGTVMGRPGLPALHNPSQTTLPAAAIHPFVTGPALRSPPAPGQIAPPAIPHGAGTPAAITHMAPPVVNPGDATTPGGIPHTLPLTTVPPAVAHTPPPVANRPLVQEPYRSAAPAAVPHPAPPPVVAHVPPPAVARPSPPDLHAPPPMVHTPPAMVHAAPPPPQVRAPPPPAAPHQPPPAQSAQHKRPGEP
jgi:hypothetical protein